jgi:hypothetical protein
VIHEKGVGMGVMYMGEKLHTARRNLMLPHPEGEAMSIMEAFHECGLGIGDLSAEDRERLGDYGRGKLERLEELMSIEGIEDPTHRGAWVVKAERFTLDEKIEVSDCIDTLAFVFDELDGADG